VLKIQTVDEGVVEVEAEVGDEEGEEDEDEGEVEDEAEGKVMVEGVEATAEEVREAAEVEVDSGPTENYSYIRKRGTYSTLITAQRIDFSILFAIIHSYFNENHL